MSNMDFERKFAESLGTETSKQAMEVAKAIVLPPAQELGKGLADLMYVALAPIRFPVERLRLLLEASQKRFIEGFQRKINAIQQEKLCDPDPQIVFNVLHDAQYCLEKDELREMFENLLASSAKTDTAAIVHPSFSSIIRQMSPFDAKVLSSFKTVPNWPVVFCMPSEPDSNSEKIQFCGDLENPDLDGVTSSLNILNFLGLISFMQYPNIVDPTGTYDNLATLFPQLDLADKLTSNNIAMLTAIGSRFIEVCM